MHEHRSFEDTELYLERRVVLSICELDWDIAGKLAEKYIQLHDKQTAHQTNSLTTKYRQWRLGHLATRMHEWGRIVPLFSDGQELIESNTRSDIFRMEALIIARTIEMNHNLSQ